MNQWCCTTRIRIYYSFKFLFNSHRVMNARFTRSGSTAWYLTTNQMAPPAKMGIMWAMYGVPARMTAEAIMIATYAMTSFMR